MKMITKQQHSMSFKLTSDQEQAQNYISTFITSSFKEAEPDSYICTLSGSAGTGKTTLTKMVVRMVRKAGKQVLCVAPTHKARKVLDSIINTGSFLRIPTSTVAGLLGKMRAHGYVGTHNYKKGLDSKIGMYDFFIVDEISMVTTGDYRDIVKLARMYEKKVLFIGDSLQIPNPSQRYVKQTVDGKTYLVKESNPAFSEPHQLQLREIVRTGQDNPLISLLGLVRDRIGTGFSLTRLATQLELELELELKGRGWVQGQDPLDSKGYLMIKDHSLFLSEIKSAAKFLQTGLYRVISYTNHSVRQYNKFIRSALGYTEDVVQGEVLTGYKTMIPIVENGQDYYVTNINVTTDRSVSANGKMFTGLSGKILSIKELEQTQQPIARSTTDVNIFLLDLDDPNNFEILEELVDLAEKVNYKGSTKKDYRNYITLKSQLIFMEDLYRYKNNIYTGSVFKVLHPLLFTQTTAVLTTKGEIIASELVNKIQEQYPGLIAERTCDHTVATAGTERKEINSNETLADMHQILERDISYGYAITAHKSQGSTYHSVFIDEPDFNSIKDCWSWRHMLDMRCATERDQLKYVALSRPTHGCYIHVLN